MSLFISASKPTLSVSSGDVWVKAESGVSICNKTQGIAQVIFKGKDEKGETTYNIKIYGKEVKYHVKFCSCPEIHDLIFNNSLKIKLELQKNDTVVYIVETDAKGQTEIYIDLTNLFKNTYAAYPNYLPQQCTLDLAKRKLTAYKQENPGLGTIISGFNKHGVFALAVDHSTVVSDHVCHESIAYFWSRPNQERLEKIGFICSASFNFKQPIITNSLAYFRLSYSPKTNTFEFNNDSIQIIDKAEIIIHSPQKQVKTASSK